MGLSVAVTSGNGGVGKTTVAAGLALAFAGTGRPTLLWELTPGRRCCDKLLSADGVSFDLADLLSGAASVRDVCTPVGGSLFLLAAPLDYGVAVDSDGVFKIGAELTRIFDTVIIDLGSDGASLRSASWADEVLFVCTPDGTSTDAAAAAFRYINRFAARPIRGGLVVNRLPSSPDEREWLSVDLSGMIDRSGLPLRAVLPRSPALGTEVPHADWVAAQTDPDPEDEQLAVRIFSALRSRLMGERVPLCLR